MPHRYIGRNRYAREAVRQHEYLRAAREWTAPALPVGGADALALGAPPGPAVGRALDEVERWWIRGDFRADREARLRKLRRVAAAKVSGSSRESGNPCRSIP